MLTPLHDPTILPDNLPVPKDDGAAKHLFGLRLPDIALSATNGDAVNLSRLAGRTVVYIYPRTGKPGQPLPTGWDAIPGARGCTPQSCAFRDHFAELKRLGVTQLFDSRRRISTISARRSSVCICHLRFCPIWTSSSRGH